MIDLKEHIQSGTTRIFDAVKREKEEGIEFNSIEYLGVIAGSFAVIAGVGQIVTLIQRQSAEDISYVFLIGACFSTAVWVLYHFLKRGGGPLVTTALTLIGLLMVLVIKIIYDTKATNDSVEKADEKIVMLYALTNLTNEEDQEEE